MLRSLPARLSGLCLLALLSSGCQRTPIFISTPTSPAQATVPAAERTASITQIKGTVETRTSTSGAWQAAGQDQVLAEGNQVRTGAGSSAVISLTEGTHIYLDANTQITLKLLNKFLDSLLTNLDLQQGRVWVLLNGGSLDVETPFGAAIAASAYMSVELAPQSRLLNVTCLQGACGFGTILIPPSYKLANAADNATPEQMQMADFGVWGARVPEATQLAYLATEAIALGSATIPAAASPTATPRPRPTITQSPTDTATPTIQQTETKTPGANTPSATVEPPTDTPTPTFTPVPSPTLPEFQPTVTPPPFTPLPAAPIIGRHIVHAGEEVFCIARGYGVLPAAIIQANGLSAPSFLIVVNQVLQIPEVQWLSIAPGPVCAPQFASPYPGLPVSQPTPVSSPTPVASTAPLTVIFDNHCIANCGSRSGTFVLQINLTARGGVPPYIYDPAQSFQLSNLPHCQNPTGSVSVTSADGQVWQKTWTFTDVSCP